MSDITWVILTIFQKFDIFGDDEGSSVLSHFGGRFDVRYYDLIYAPAPKPGTSCKSQFAYWTRNSSSSRNGIDKKLYQNHFS